MSARRVEVEISGRVFLEFDDEAVSDWDGRTLLTRHENTEAYLPGSTARDVLAAAAVTVGVWGSRDGFADFPDDAIKAWAFPEAPEINSVVLDGQVL